jgi:hypothetical protein
MSWIKAHPYFVESLALLAAALIFVCFLPRGTRLLAACGGIVATPFAFLAVVHSPGFWRPALVFDGNIGREDFLWCAAAGMTVWSFALWPARKRSGWRCDWRAMTVRAAIVGGLGAALHWPVLAVMPGPAGRMPATLASMAGAAAILVGFGARIPARRAALPALAYALYHWLDVTCFFFFWPETRAYWNPAAQLPFAIAGAPAYEVIWALVFGATWPVIMTFVTACHAAGGNLDRSDPGDTDGATPRFDPPEKP